MQVTRIRLYPVKSLAGPDVGSARVEPWGLTGDRRWAVVNAAGEPLTARERNAMLGLHAEPLAGGGVLLSDRGGAGDPLWVDPPMEAAPVPVGYTRQGTALPAGDEADGWLSTRLATSVRLIWQPDPLARPMNPDHGGRPGDGLTFADAGPLLLTSEASLAALDALTDDDTPPLDMLRFRPNIVIDGDEPFTEEGWTFVELGGVRFRVTEVCDRCVMTTIDPVTLARSKEPIRTLARHRKRDGKTWFGVRIAPEAGGEVGVGDDVRAG